MYWEIVELSEDYIELQGYEGNSDYSIQATLECYPDEVIITFSGIFSYYTISVNSYDLEHSFFKLNFDFGGLHDFLEELLDKGASEDEISEALDSLIQIDWDNFNKVISLTYEKASQEVGYQFEDAVAEVLGEDIVEKGEYEDVCSEDSCYPELTILIDNLSEEQKRRIAEALDWPPDWAEEGTCLRITGPVYAWEKGGIDYYRFLEEITKDDLDFEVTDYC